MAHRINTTAANRKGTPFSRTLRRMLFTHILSYTHKQHTQTTVEGRQSTVPFAKCAWHAVTLKGPCLRRSCWRLRTRYLQVLSARYVCRCVRVFVRTCLRRSCWQLRMCLRRSCWQLRMCYFRVLRICLHGIALCVRVPVCMYMSGVDFWTNTRFICMCAFVCMYVCIYVFV